MSRIFPLSKLSKYIGRIKKELHQWQKLPNDKFLKLEIEPKLGGEINLILEEASLTHSDDEKWNDWDKPKERDGWKIVNGKGYSILPHGTKVLSESMFVGDKIVDIFKSKTNTEIYIHRNRKWCEMSVRRLIKRVCRLAKRIQSRSVYSRK